MIDAPTPTTGTPLPTTNKIETVINTAISNVASASVTAIMTAAIAWQPWLGWPGIKQLAKIAVSYVITEFSLVGQLEITFIINKIDASIENSDLVTAEKAVQAAIASGDANAIQIAEIAFQKAQSVAANSGGSARPQ